MTPLPTSSPTTAHPWMHPPSCPFASDKDPPLTLAIIFQASKVSGIKNFFYSLLLLFTSPFFVSGGGISILSRGVIPTLSLVLVDPHPYALSSTDTTSGLMSILWKAACRAVHLRTSTGRGVDVVASVVGGGADSATVAEASILVPP